MEIGLAPGLTDWLIELLIFSSSVFIVAQISPIVHVEGFGTAIIVAIIYAVLNVIFRNALISLLRDIDLYHGQYRTQIVSFAATIILLWLTDKLISGFEVRGVLRTIIAALLISIVDIGLHWVIFSSGYIL